MKDYDLKEVLRLHALWPQRYPEGVRADLSNTLLGGADLGDAKGLPKVPVVSDLHRKVAEAVGANGEHPWFAAERERERARVFAAELGSVLTNNTVLNIANVAGK